MIVFVVAAFLHVTTAEFTIVNTTNGRIQGSLESTIPEGNSYYAFKGIRYAEPPERFEPAVPVKNWNNIYDATADKATCIQVPKSTNKESEDCLYLSVYTPNLPEYSVAKFAVMFWIYGGGFISGDNFYSTYSPDYLLDNEVIVVTINYRLNLLGFLSTGDNIIPGNNGIKDLILGLQWVQQNIAYFGGDPNKVTIFGESAGAVLVSYLVTSPLTQGKGYFHGAILESGHNLFPWGYQRDPVTTFNQVVRASLCKNFNPVEDSLIKCLKRLPVQSIRNIALAVLGASVVFGLNILNGITFAPVTEQPSPTAAVTGLPYQLLLNKQIPNISIIHGINSEESLAFSNTLPLLRPLFAQIDIHSSILVPTDMYAANGDVQKFIAPTVKNYYFDRSPVVLSSDSKVLRFLSDTEFNRPFREAFTLMKNQTPAYCYQFSYSSALTGQYKNYSGLGKVGHAGELSFLFRSASNKDVLVTHQDQIAIARFTRLWTNFAKTGNPTPYTNDTILLDTKWPTAWISGSNVNCLNFGQQLSIIRNPKEQGYQMWKKLYDTYGHPRDTYK